MLSIPERATQLVDKILSQIDEDNSRTIFLVGSKSVGKSTLIYSFLDKSDTPRETLVLDYSFGRKSNQKQGIDKTLCHIWEYGGKLETLKNILPSIPSIGKYFFCVMVDLSKLKNLWNTIEICFEAMREVHTESDSSPEPIIICGKYDVFKNYDTEVKKFVCTSIRSIALLHNANLLFYSSKDPHLVKRAKEMLNNIAFGNNIPLKEKIINYTKPLLITRGSDTWESIGIASSTLKEARVRHISKIPPDAECSMSTTSTSQKYAHPEPALDSLATLKYDQIRRIESLDISIDDYLLNINT